MQNRDQIVFEIEDLRKMIIVNLCVYFSVVLSFVLLPASSSIDADETTLSTNNLDQNNEAAYKCLDPNLLGESLVFLPLFLNAVHLIVLEYKWYYYG